MTNASASPAKRAKLPWLLGLLLLGAGALAGKVYFSAPDAGPGDKAEPRFHGDARFGFWWGGVPDAVKAVAEPTGAASCIDPQDYVGAARCAACHEPQHQDWLRHPHRLMNAAATPANVVGDFTGPARFPYLDGEGTFWRDGDTFHMAAARGTVRRVFRVTRTIGSRYFQYYVGVQTAGPEPAADPRYRVDHVLPFGYWLKRREWVPTVHIRDDRPGDYDDPKLNPYEDFFFTDYDRNCAQCHTTVPLGDWLTRNPAEAARYTPHPFSLDLTSYLRRHRPELVPDPPGRLSDDGLHRLVVDLVENRPPARLLKLGIECEACHNGGRDHAAGPGQRPPYFFPAAPDLHARLPADRPHGRSRENVNWVCARCHNGGRPLFPGGIATWNSTEYTDATRGACYSRLRCVDCHDPHRPTGLAWPHPPDHDDGLCLKCHQSYRAAPARLAHTRHPPGSPGDRCMNCHMPRLNEGMDTVVRTHTIFSPTRAAGIEQNGPNACNLCHLDRSLDWTLAHLKDWYGKTYDAAAIARHYPDRTRPLGETWLAHPFPATRLVAAAAYGRKKDAGDLPALLPILDDRYLLNRQFGELAVEALAGTPLRPLGYHFTLSPAQRAAVLPKVRAGLLNRTP